MTDHNDHDPQADQVFVADPSTADIFDDEPILPKWPKVFGIFAICFGSFFFLCGGVGTVFLFLQPQMMASFESNFEGGVPPVLLTANPMQVAVAFAGVALSAMLIFAGIMCILRKPLTRKLFLIYAVAAIGLGIWSLSLQLDQQAAINQWNKENPNADFANQPGGQIGQIIGLVIGIALGLGWPAFCLFWFGFVKTKPDQFTGGANIEVL